jgi:branched-chain amino acid transport system substrate-binding protein
MNQAKSPYDPYIRPQFLMLAVGLHLLVMVQFLGDSAVAQEAGADGLKFGMSTAISGPSAELGLNMRYGVLAAFAEANRRGGIAGRKLELIVLDDGYEPSRTAPNMHTLIQQHQVLGIIGNVGTPTAIAAIPIAEREHVPFFGPFSGASVLRKNVPDRFVINYRASNAEETAAMVDALVAAGINPGEIGFFTQNDSSGDDGFSGGIAAIRKYENLPQSAIARGHYNRNTLNIEGGLADLLLHRPLPKAVIMVGTYAPCAKMISLAKQNNFTPMFLGVSFMGCDTLLKTLGPLSEGVIITQVVPHYHSDLPLVAKYRQALENFDEDLPYDFGSLEGYISATILIRAIKTIDGPITRESINRALENLGNFDIGLGTQLSISDTDHQACERVWPIQIIGMKPVPLSWEEIRLCVQPAL